VSIPLTLYCISLCSPGGKLTEVGVDCFNGSPNPARRLP
jgi:hypothetical protein